MANELKTVWAIWEVNTFSNKDEGPSIYVVATEQEIADYIHKEAQAPPVGYGMRVQRIERLGFVRILGQP